MSSLHSPMVLGACARNLPTTRFCSSEANTMRLLALAALGAAAAAAPPPPPPAAAEAPPPPPCVALLLVAAVAALASAATFAWSTLTSARFLSSV